MLLCKPQQEKKTGNCSAVCTGEKWLSVQLLISRLASGKRCFVDWSGRGQAATGKWKQGSYPVTTFCLNVFRRPRPFLLTSSLPCVASLFLPGFLRLAEMAFPLPFVYRSTPVTRRSSAISVETPRARQIYSSGGRNSIAFTCSMGSYRDSRFP